MDMPNTHNGCSQRRDQAQSPSSSPIRQSTFSSPLPPYGTVRKILKPKIRESDRSSPAASPPHTHDRGKSRLEGEYAQDTDSVVPEDAPASPVVAVTESASQSSPRSSAMGPGMLDWILKDLPKSETHASLPSHRACDSVLSSEHANASGSSSCASPPASPRKRARSSSPAPRKRARTPSPVHSRIPSSTPIPDPSPSVSIANQDVPRIQTNSAKLLSSPVSAETPALLLLSEEAAPCSHPRHPAYISSYSHDACPKCRMTQHIVEVQQLNSIIASHNGFSAWKDEITALKNSRRKNRAKHRRAEYQRLVPGSDRHRNKNVVNGEVSFRHAHKRMHNTVIETMALAEQEQKWEAEDEVSDAPSYWSIFSASTALEIYRNAMDEGQMNREKDREAFVSRKRGYQNAIEADPDYEAEEESIGIIWNPDVDDSEIPPPSTSASIKEPLKRKRRAIQGVTFNPEVYVRTDCDVDVLRKEPSFNPNAVPKPHPQQHGTSQARRGILRTNTKSSSILPRPKLPHSIIRLHEEDRKPRPKSSWKPEIFNRYQAGIWAALDGRYERVNPGLCQKEWCKAMEYSEELQHEANDIDIVDTSPVTTTQGTQTDLSASNLFEVVKVKDLAYLAAHVRGWL